MSVSDPLHTINTFVFHNTANVVVHDGGVRSREGKFVYLVRDNVCHVCGPDDRETVHFIDGRVAISYVPVSLSEFVRSVSAPTLAFKCATPQDVSVQCKDKSIVFINKRFVTVNLTAADSSETFVDTPIDKLRCKLAGRAQLVLTPKCIVKDVKLSAVSSWPLRVSLSYVISSLHIEGRARELHLQGSVFQRCEVCLTPTTPLQNIKLDRVVGRKIQPLDLRAYVRVDEDAVMQESIIQYMRDRFRSAGSDFSSSFEMDDQKKMECPHRVPVKGSASAAVVPVRGDTVHTCCVCTENEATVSSSCGCLITCNECLDTAARTIESCYLCRAKVEYLTRHHVDVSRAVASWTLGGVHMEDTPCEADEEGCAGCAKNIPRVALSCGHVLWCVSCAREYQKKQSKCVQCGGAIHHATVICASQKGK